jgi:hypothetical protein
MQNIKVGFVVALIIAGSGILIEANLAAAQSSGDAVFGNLGVSIGSSANINGAVASNGNVAVNTFCNLAGLSGGGSLLGNSLGDFNVSGAVTFNGSVTTGQYATFQSPINSGGTVNIGVGATTAAITAGGDVLESQSAQTNGSVLAGGSFGNSVFGVVTGNVTAGANVTVAGTVDGNVTCGGQVSVGKFGSIEGNISTGTTPVVPATYSPITTPNAIPFSSGGADVTTGGSAASPLPPGSYGNLTIPTFGNLYLTAGNYEFSSFTFDGNSINLVNLNSSNQINIFVSGNVSESTFATMSVDGEPYASAATSLAGNVLLETLGTYSQNTLGSVQFFGTIFAPDGDIDIGNYSSLTGSLIAGGNVNLNVGFNETFAPPSELPEPASLGLLGMGWMLLLRRTRSSVP